MPGTLQTLPVPPKVNEMTMLNAIRLAAESGGGSGGTGTVTSVSVVTANGVSATVATATTTPALTFTLGAITPSSVNALTLAAAATGFTIAGGTSSKTLTVLDTGTAALLGIAQTFSAANIFSVNGAASTPALSLTGTPFTGGTATTTKPLFNIEPTGTTSTGWSTSGTMLGVNAASGFGGSLISAQVASAERFRVQANGVIQLNGDTGGTIARRSDVNMIMLNSVGAGNVGMVGIGGPGFLQGISLALGSALVWTNDSPASTMDIALRRQAAGILDLSATGSTNGAALQFSEQTAPAAPAANSVRIYAVDNGSGKTQLMALFSSGAAQQIAIQP